MVCVLSFFRSSDSSFQPYLAKAYYKGYESHTVLKTVVIMKCESWSIFICWVKISLDIEVAQVIFKASIKSWRESLFHFRSPHLLNSLFLVGDIHLPNYTNAKWLDELLIWIRGQPLCNYFLFDGCACCMGWVRVVTSVGWTGFILNELSFERGDVQWEVVLWCCIESHHIARVGHLHKWSLEALTHPL